MTYFHTAVEVCPTVILLTFTVKIISDLLSHRGRGLSHCPSGEHRVSLSPVAMVYPGTHWNEVRDPGVNPTDMAIILEFSGTRISPHRISVERENELDTWEDKVNTEHAAGRLFSGCHE